MNHRTLLAGLAIVAAACSNPVDTTPNKLPTADNSADSSGETAAAGSCGCAKVGTWYRFTELVLTSIDSNPKHLAIQQLNALWKKDIKGWELNFYAELTAVKPGSIEMRVVNGARVAGTTDEVCLVEATAEKITHPPKASTITNTPQPAIT